MFARTGATQSMTTPERWLPSAVTFASGKISWTSSVAFDRSWSPPSQLYPARRERYVRQRGGIAQRRQRARTVRDLEGEGRVAAVLWRLRRRLPRGRFDTRLLTSEERVHHRCRSPRTKKCCPSAKNLCFSTATFRGNSARSSRRSSRNCALCRPLRQPPSYVTRIPETTRVSAHTRRPRPPHISAAAPDALAAFFSASFATT